jgi:pimeloyl-ACP methyl ester carboxylesterase
MLNIYIEGDGRAWLNKHTLSDDPTPSNPVALKLAVADQGGNIAYIARPGQYQRVSCDAKYWSASRFAPEVITSMDQAIDQLKAGSGAKAVALTGYSGGGAIAVLVAARRADVVALRTVAGNLNTTAWCAYHHVSQLDGSLNPLDAAFKTANIPQRHFIGNKDKIMPAIIAESFVKAEGDKDASRITRVKSASHNEGWEGQWKELLSMSCK